MDNKEFAKEPERRTRKSAVEMIHLSSRIPNSLEGIVVRNQITKSGTSMGANSREADHARSNAEFKSKIKVCERGASETQYRLEVVVEAEMLS
jgi:four helix bundle protein